MISIKSVFELIVPEYIPMAVLGAFVGVVGTTNALPGPNFLILILSLIFVVAGFNTYNAIADKKIDQINKPSRPIASNKITERQAKKLTVLFYAIAFFLSLTLNPLIAGIIIFSILITALYSFKPIYLKQRFVAGNLVGAILYGLISPLAGWALTPTLGLPIAIISTLFFLAIGLSFLKDFEDVVGDKKYGINTLPLKIGRHRSIGTILIVTTVAFAYLTYATFSALLPQKYYFILIFYPIIFFNIYSYKNPANKILISHLFRTTVTIIMGLEIAIALITLAL
ncbi:Digeranylgeranylglyceryl phosphate synthase [uncultured archaeon]|nr:Digeranylgeranylglyceryl phosphate synthase [uncultured archaeon]